MFLTTLTAIVFIRRYALVAVVGIFTSLVTFTNQALGQGISFSGITEGSVILLAPGSPTTTLSVTANPSSPSSPTNIAFNLERHGSVILSLTSPPPYGVTFTNLPTGKYFLTATLIAPGTPPQGDLSFTINATSLAPANDNWNQAGALPGLNVSVSGTNTYATRQANEPSPGGACAGKSVWWAWTATSNGVFTATTAGSTFDTVLGVYTGTNLITLMAAGANDDAGANAYSQVTFFATNGITYYFMVDSASGGVGGRVRFRLTSDSPPQVGITAPPDGHLMLVTAATIATNVTATIAASDPLGITQVNYWFDGGTNVSRSGTLEPPYQLSLTNLFVGHYVLTVAAANNAGLVTQTNIGISVISLEPVLSMDRVGSSPGKFQMGMTGFKGPNYTLLASTNLDVWCGVRTFTNFGGAVKVADTNIAQFKQRFYRAASAQ